MYCFRNEQVGRSMDKIGWCNTSVMRADNVDNNARVVINDDSLYSCSCSCISKLAHSRDMNINCRGPMTTEVGI